MMVIIVRKETMSVFTHQQDPHCHHGSGSGGHRAVHEDDMIFADVFGQTQVMQLQGGDTFPWLPKQEGELPRRHALCGRIGRVGGRRAVSSDAHVLDTHLRFP